MNLQTANYDVICLEGSTDRIFSEDYSAKLRAAQPNAQIWWVVDQSRLPESVRIEEQEHMVKLIEKPVRSDDILMALQGIPSNVRSQISEAHVLIVSIDPHFSGALLDLISMEGHRGRTAREGAEALREVHRQFYHMVLIDTNVKDMPFWSLANLLHEINSELVVIVMAEHASKDILMQAMRADVYDFMLKPLDSFALRRTLRRALDKRQMALQIRSFTSSTR